MFCTEREAKTLCKKCIDNHIAKNPKVEKSDANNYWHVVLSVVPESKKEQAVMYFLNHGIFAGVAV